MSRLIAVLILSCLLLSGVPHPAGSAVDVSRTGSENPMVEVARSVIWGGVAGLVVGSAIALASNGDNSGDIIKWSFVGGTFLGLGFGVYHVTTRPQPSSALDGSSLGLEALAPTPELEPARYGDATLGMMPLRDPLTGAPVSIVRMRF